MTRNKGKNKFLPKLYFLNKMRDTETDAERQPLQPKRRKRKRIWSEGSETMRKKRVACWLGGIALTGLCIIVIAATSIYIAYEKGSGPGGELDTDKPFNETFAVLPEHFPLRDQLKSSPIRQLSNETLSQILDEAAEMYEMKQTLDADVLKQQLYTEPGSPDHFLHMLSAARPAATLVEQQGYYVDYLSTAVANKLNMDKTEASRGMGLVPGLNLTELCDRPLLEPNWYCNETKYRSADGTCNNLQEREWGAAFTAYRRMLIPDYQDGISTPRASSSGAALPSARAISTSVNTDTYYGDAGHSMLLVQWGEFVAHDIAGTAASKSVPCCSPSLLDSPTAPPQCYPISVPPDDTFLSQYNVSCLQFVRSVPAPRCQLGPRDQLNQVTSFLDGSTIYGSTQQEQDLLRSFEKGMLEYSLGPNDTELLPIQGDDTGTLQGCNMKSNNVFSAGDSRVNEQPLLTASHTLWLREHNRVAKVLHALNPQWTDQTLFQESRRIIIAELQHITYNEYLPQVLGYETCFRLGFLSKDENYDDNDDTAYDDTMDPSIGNAVAAAAFRFGHSQIQGFMKTTSISNDTEVKKLHDSFFQPLEFFKPAYLHRIVNGHMNMEANAVDRYFSKEVTNHLFERSGSSHGLDLVALNIQRGRDHGIPGYNAWRRHCGLPTAHTFNQLRRMGWPKDMVEATQKLYRSPDDIDLYTGALGEPPMSGGIIGPTFACILADQFVRLKRGDRFWYETTEGPQAFTPEQLQEIRNVTFSRILCDNIMELSSIQPSAFLLSGPENGAVYCNGNGIPNMNLRHWEAG